MQADEGHTRVFSIIISEKGGAERREAFDKNEINVGRVQGNDLMLPKGNVSKHHARLLFRDGRFIVTDLKSTNGTYVNGRKIAQATIVREGDKIYIGDFVLRLETNGASANPEAAANEEDSIRTVARDNARPAPAPAPPAVTLKAPTHPPGAPLPRPQVNNVSNAPSPGMQGGSVPPPPLAPPPQPMAPPPQPGGSMAPPPGQFNIDANDPDDSSPMHRRNPSAAPPPAAPGPRPMTMPLNQQMPPIIGTRVPTAPPGGIAISPAPQPIVPAPPPPQPIAAAPMPQPMPAPLPPPPQAPPPQPMAPPVAMSPAPQPLGPPPFGPPPGGPPPLGPPPGGPPPMAGPPPQQHTSAPPGRATSPPRARVEPPAQAARRLAMAMLIDRIGDAVDLALLGDTSVVPEALAQQIERAAREQAQAMRDEGEAPQDVDLDAVVREAHRELVGLGAFTPLLDDDEVSEIHVVRFDQVFTVRNGQTLNEGLGFSNDEALERIVRRLAQTSGEAWAPGDLVIERRLPRATMVAVCPPASHGHVVSIKKRHRIESTLEDLVRANSLSKQMAQFLEACVGAKANVLVSGNAPLTMIAALAAVANGERLAVVQDIEEISVPNAHVVALAAGEASVRAASKLRADRLVVTHLAGGSAAAVMDAMVEGHDGVVAALAAPTLRQGLSRLVAQLVMNRPGLGLEAMRDVVGEAFDLAVEVSALGDGRLRVMRIAELGGADAKGIVSRDIFVFNPDASGEGSFGATGVVPRIANDLAARGTKLDGTMFKRGGR